MNERTEEIKHEKIETTIGELIFAISEAAAEAQLDEEDLEALTQLVLSSMLERYQY